MKKIFLLTITITTCLLDAYTQDYKEILKNADSSFKSGDLLKAYNLYKQIPQEFKLNSGEYLNAARSGAFNKDFNFALDNLSCFIEIEKEVLLPNSLDGFSEFKDLKSEPKWDKLINVIIEYRKNKEKRINTKIRDEIRLMRLKDDEMQILNEPIKERYPVGSLEYNHFMKEWDSIVNANTQRIMEIIRQYGWPNDSIFGTNSSSYTFFILQHSHSLEAKEECLPYVKNAAEKGELDRQLFAMYQDRLLIKQGRKQLYGTQYYFDKESQKTKLHPVFEEDKLNERRKKIGLEPINLKEIDN